MRIFELKNFYRRKIYFFLTFLLFFFFNSKSQLFNFKKYSPKDGLANSNVKQIFQSKNGYLWMTTQGGGLSRFDGKNFKNYSKKDGLVSNDLSCIEEDSEGNLWIGTVEGLCIFNGFSFIMAPVQAKIGKNLIYHIYKDSFGNMWISTDTKGLFIVKKDKIITIDTTTGLKSNRIFSVVQENSNSFWVGTHRGGTYHLNSDGKIVSCIDSIPNAPRASAFCLYKSSKNEIYAGTNNAGLYKIINKKFVKVNIPGLENVFVGSIITDKKNNLWVATEFNGILKHSGNSTKFFGENEGLSSNVINSLASDDEGNIWVATQNGGVCMLKNDVVLSYTIKDGLSNNKINAVLKLKDRSVIVSTMGKGICIQDNATGKFEKLKISSTLDESLISNILELKENLLILGSDIGIFIVKKSGEQFKLEKYINEIAGQALSSPVLGISADENNTFWVTFFGEGLVHFNEAGDFIEKYDVKNGLSTNQLISLHRDHKKNLYVGQFTNNILVKKNGKPEPLDIGSFKDLTTTWCITSDNKGGIFFGTQDGGLIIWHKGKFTQISVSDGICSNYIQSVVRDNKGNLWIGTDKGVNKIMLDENYKVVQIRNYSSQEGLISPEVSLNGIINDSEGFVWICTSEGLTRIDDAHDEPNLNPPKLILSDIRLHYEHVDWKNFSDNVNITNNIPINLKLPYHENHLTFDFRALTTDNVKYKFILENLDDSWSPYSKETQAVYSNIPPGNYTFKVKAINSFGMESKDEISFSFTITPPFWKTWWFYILCIFLVTSGMFGFFKWRTAKLEREKKILEGKVNERTLELKGANENLSVALHDIKDSINYAERIQRAMLPDEVKINDYLPDSFILFKPRDIVSGDFYWFIHKNDIDYVAAVDCTGHGVPGAFMSLVGSSLLNEIVQTKGISNPSLILAQLNSGVQNSLRQRENNTRDGMDLAFCAIDYKNKKLTYAGANRSLWIVKKDSQKLEEIKATKNAIGGFTEEDQEFKSHSLSFNKGDTVYMHSDGFADQFGGKEGKKLMTKRFKEILLSVQNQSMKNQRDSLNYEITNWMGGKYEQVDDILVIGIRF